MPTLSVHSRLKVSQGVDSPSIEVTAVDEISIQCMRLIPLVALVR